MDSKTNAIAQRLLQRYAIQPGLLSRRKINAVANRHNLARAPLLLRLQRWMKMTSSPQMLRTASGYVYSKPAFAKTMQQNENAMSSFSGYPAITADSIRSVHASPAIGKVVAGMAHGKLQNGGSHAGHIEPSSKHRIAPTLVASEKIASHRSAGERGTIKTAPYTAIHNNFAAKMMNNQWRAGKLAKSSMANSALGLLHRKIELNEDIVQAQKTRVAESKSEQSHNTSHSSNNTESHIETGFKQHVNQSESPPSAVEAKTQTHTRPQIAGAKPTQPHVLQARAASGYGNEFGSSNFHSKQNGKFSRTIITRTIGDFPVLNKADDHKPPGSNMSASAGQGDTVVTNAKVTNTTIRNIGPEIRSRALLSPSMPITTANTIAKIATKKERTANVDAAKAQRRPYDGHSSPLPPSPQGLPAKPTIIATKATLAKSQPAVVDAAPHTYVRPGKSDSGDSNNISNAVQQNLGGKVETKSIVQRQNNSTVLVSRAIVQRNSKLANNTSSLHSNKVNVPNTRHMVAQKDVAGSRSVQLRTNVSGGDRYRQMLKNQSLPVTGASLELNPHSVAKSSFKLNRQVSMDNPGSMPPPALVGKHKVKGKNYASLEGVTHNSGVTVLARTAKADALNRKETNSNELHPPAYGAPWEGGPVLPSIQSPMQNNKRTSDSHSIMKSALHTKEFPVVSRFNAQFGRDINTKNYASDNTQAAPLLRLNGTHNFGTQSVQTNKSYRTESGAAHRLQTANDTASGVPGTQSPVSAGQSDATATATTSPTVDTTATASQIMQLEQHELEYLANQIYEIIEDRLELERESMGLM